jgi:diphthamide synthase (EF-2-diphthine--ammonia ligase)
MKKAIVLLSGGQNSIVALFWAKNSFDEVHCITFTHGHYCQKQIEAAKQAAELANVVSHKIVSMPEDGDLFSAIPNEMGGSVGIRELVTGSRKVMKPCNDFSINTPLLNLTDKKVLELAACLNGCRKALANISVDYSLS